MNLKRLSLFALLLFAVPAHAVNISLGTPFPYRGKYWVPVMATNVPSTLYSVINVNVVFGGTLAIDSTAIAGDSLQTVWPNQWPSLPTGQGGAHYDDIGLGYQCYLGAWYQYLVGCEEVCNSSGILTVIPVVGCGSVYLDDVVGSAYTCGEVETTLVVDETPINIGCSGGGGGLEGMTTQTEGPPAAKTATKPRTSWGAIKRIYR